MSRQGALGFGVAAVAWVLVNCGGRVVPGSDGPDFGTGGDIGGSGGAAGSPSDGVGGRGTGATGGSTGGTGMGGSAGNGGSSTRDGSTGNPFIDLIPGFNDSPICRSCVSTLCAGDVAPCSYTASCVAGAACIWSTCVDWNDAPCMNKCFHDDMQDLSKAILALGCVHAKCGVECF